MTTLQGIISKGIVNAEMQFERMAVASSNVANYNTNGYKAVRFEQVLDEYGCLKGVERTDFSQGSIQRTARELDVAINGMGFIPVTSANGEVSYTREGSFMIDKDGYLVTNDGYLVGDGIQVPINYENLQILPNGDIESYSNDGTRREYLGTIPLVNFRNPEGLKKGDNNKFYLTADSGEPVLDKNNKKFVHGSLELTNIDMVGEVNQLIRLNASMLASFKVMKTINDMYTQAMQLNQ